jgi:heterotetrameric sarcosine oxidase delta subunit
MLLIPCPHCGPRAELEFVNGGEAHRPRPDLLASDEAWARYLHLRDNPRGVVAERWLHRSGCGQWFNLLRDTTTHEILAVYGATDPRPEVAS